MRKFQTYVLSGAALSGLFVIGSLMHSRDSQAKAATYSTPVAVMNTTSQPAITSGMDDPGRIPYESHQILPTENLPSEPLFSFPAVPPNHRLVVQRVGGVMS